MHLPCPCVRPPPYNAAGATLSDDQIDAYCGHTTSPTTISVAQQLRKGSKYDGEWKRGWLSCGVVGPTGARAPRTHFHMLMST